MTKLKPFQIRLFLALVLGIGASSTLAAAPEHPASAAPAKTVSAVPWSEIGSKAGADYRGDGLAVSPTAEGAQLRCVFQRLEGEATREGLWLTSTVTSGVMDRFRVTATEVGRLADADVRNPLAPFMPMSIEGPRGFGVRQSSGAFEVPTASPKRQGPAAVQDAGALGRTGTVQVADKVVRFLRPGVVEEYSVSMDGVRQDFVIEHPPLNSQLSTLNQRPGELAVWLAVSGARVEPVAGGAQLVLENSGRKIAYSRLRVTDATGKELTARMEVASGILPGVEGAHPAARNLAADYSRASLQDTPESAGLEAPALRQAGMPAATMLVVVVNDAEAVYPVRIDPTFSDANWISMGGILGANGQVNAAVVDGSGNLYIGGYFTVVGDVIANNIAKWDGSSWSALGSGMNGFLNTFVGALAVSGSDVYAGGWFTTAGGVAATNIAKWNGSSWSALGSGMNGYVSALAVSGSGLYAGGGFTTAGGSAASSIAKWNGSSWSALGSGLGSGINSDVSALAVSGSDLYVGGYFTTAGGSAASSIAKWDGSSWTALGSGIDGSVEALAVSGSNLYAGGSFTTAGGSAAIGIAKWDGNSWSALGSGMNGYVSALAVSGSDLYVGGYFTTAGGSAALGIAKWNGSSWSALGSGMGPFYPATVLTLAVSGSDLYAGGSLANYIAKWDGSSWSALGSGSGMNGQVNALAVSGSDLYAGGQFTTAGGSPANNIAKWNGSSWSGLGSGMNSGLYYPYVNALAVSGSDVYAGGYFTTAGGSPATNIAKWDGSSWSALGSGINGDVRALAVSGSDLYAGGGFATAGGVAATNIAKWNGSGWSALGSGMGGGGGSPLLVQALAVSGSNVYAGGGYSRIGGDGLAQMAKWDGSSWTALGSGLNGSVYALAVSGSDLYAGGSVFVGGQDGGSGVNAVAKWDGTNWLGLGGLPGTVLNGIVYALAVSGSVLYAGGAFTNAGGILATNIAKWNGTSWSALGSGMNSGVYALAVSGSDLYAGGYFTTAGGKVSANVARAIVNPPVLAIEGDGDGGYFIRFSGVPGSAYRLERALGLSGPWTASGPYTAPATGRLEFWDLFPPPGHGFYRSVGP